MYIIIIVIASLGSADYKHLVTILVGDKVVVLLNCLVWSLVRKK